LSIDRIVAERQSAQSALERAEELGPLLDPGPPTKAERDNPDYIRDEEPEYGTSATYLARRLKRDHAPIYDRLQAGEFPSVRAAALEAGIVRKTITVPMEVEGAARVLRRHFSADDLEALAEALTA
jgi:hypothetical protein